MPKLPKKSEMGGLASMLLASTTVKENKRPHIVVIAGAGTGKTTTIVESINRRLGRADTKLQYTQEQHDIFDAVCQDPSSNVAVVSYSKSIIADISNKLPKGIEARTLHSFGYRTVMRHYPIDDVNGVDSALSMAKSLFGSGGMKYTDKIMVKAALPLLDMAKATLTPPGEGHRKRLEHLARRFALQLPKTVNEQNMQFDIVEHLLSNPQQLAESGLISHADMIWLCVVLDLEPVTVYDLLCVDECLPGWTPVMMADGGSKQIKDIVAGDRVRSFNTEKGRAMNCVVTATQKIPNKKPLVKIKVRHNHRTAGNYRCNQVTCTTDHKVWTVNRGWVQAGQIQLDDTVIIETAATTTQKGKITKAGRRTLSSIHVGNSKGTGSNGGQTAEYFNRVKGGNGRGPTTPQIQLHEDLGEGWEMEYVVNTESRKLGTNLPTCYKIDVANPVHKIAIEIDGKSHNSKSIHIDNKKDEFLRSKGWKVHRVTNAQIARDYAGILQDVCPDGTLCPMPATVVAIDDTYITEHHVYDISVDTCHNFYANGILVHNCQDLTACQQAWALRMGRRKMIVGDPNQSIGNWNGSLDSAIEETAKQLSKDKVGYRQFTLTMTRRCSKAVVKLANRIVEDYYAHHENADGQIAFRDYAQYHDTVHTGDFVLCRTNGPLIGEYYQLEESGIEACVVGKSYGVYLKGICEELPVGGLTLIDKLTSWYLRAMKNTGEDDETRMALLEAYACLCHFGSRPQVDTVKKLVHAIDQVFVEEPIKDRVSLMTVHRSKGLEADNVHLLLLEGRNNWIPYYAATTPAQLAEERRLEYVAITRARFNFAIVTDNFQRALSQFGL